MRLRYRPNAIMHCGLSVFFPLRFVATNINKTIKFLKYKIYQKARKNRQKREKLEK
jgi:hypothetical protein